MEKEEEKEEGEEERRREGKQTKEINWLRFCKLVVYERSAVQMLNHSGKLNLKIMFIRLREPIAAERVLTQLSLLAYLRASRILS